MTEHERRSYDIEIAGLKNEMSELREEFKTEMEKTRTEFKADIKELMDAWKTAKGITGFVRWLSGMIIACGVIILALREHIK